MARRRAIVKSQARQACSSPRKPRKPRQTCTQVSDATSSVSLRCRHPEVAEQIRVTVAPQHRECGFAALLGGRHHAREVVTNHSLEYRH